MPLISCPECQNQLSDQALSCPKCGYPLANQIRNEAVNRQKSVSDQDIEFAEQIMALIRDDEGIYDPLEIRVGRIVKTRVQLDSETISFGGRSQRCNSIDTIGWWSQTTKNIEWAQNEWTTGWVWLRSKGRSMKLTVPGKYNFQVITEKIWTFVGIRLLQDILLRLHDGGDVTLCGLSMNTEGLRLKKFGAETETVPWIKITHGIWDGKITISSRSDKRRKISVSFRHNDNVPVLAALLDLREHLIKRES